MSGSLVHPFIHSFNHHSFIQSLNTIFMDPIYAGSILGTGNSVCVSSRSVVFKMLWTVAHQAPPSQVRILEWIAILFSRGPSQPRNWTQVSCTASRFFAVWATREAWEYSGEDYRSNLWLKGVSQTREGGFPVASAHTHGLTILQHNTASTSQRVRELPFGNVSIDHLAQHLSKKTSPNMTVKIEKVRLRWITCQSNSYLLSLGNNNFVNSP